MNNNKNILISALLRRTHELGVEVEGLIYLSHWET
jgi:hypothetical protein